jgi:hypothetical protein
MRNIIKLALHMHVYCFFLIKTLKTGNVCASNPCQNGGTCRTINGNGYQCLCVTGTTGINCETREHTLDLISFLAFS